MFPIQSTTEDSAKLYVDDVFSTYLYTGNGSTQTINNGIDLAGKGGMVWIKQRGNTTSNALFDTTAAYGFSSNQTSAKGAFSSLTSYLSNGFALNTADVNFTNGSGLNYTSWTFRKAPKFFDVVTWTGNGGVVTANIPITLSMFPGMAVIKKTSDSEDWIVLHRGLGGLDGNDYLKLNTTDAKLTKSDAVAGFINQVSPGNYIRFTQSVNASGATYVAYLFAHDPEV